MGKVVAASHPQQADSQNEVIDRLRLAWRHADQASEALKRAHQHSTQRDLLEAFLLQAEQNVQKSMIAIEEAANTIRGRPSK